MASSLLQLLSATFASLLGSGLGSPASALKPTASATSSQTRCRSSLRRPAAVSGIPSERRKGGASPREGSRRGRAGSGPPGSAAAPVTEERSGCSRTGGQMAAEALRPKAGLRLSLCAEPAINELGLQGPYARARGRPSVQAGGLQQLQVRRVAEPRPRRRSATGTTGVAGVAGPPPRCLNGGVIAATRRIDCSNEPLPALIPCGDERSRRPNPGIW